MKVHSSRALFASLGASMTIIAAVAFLLFSVSAVVALQGWPGLDSVPTRPALVLEDSAAMLPSGAPGSREADAPMVMAAAPRRAAAGRSSSRRIVRATAAPVTRTPVQSAVTHRIAALAPVSRPGPLAAQPDAAPLSRSKRGTPTASDAVRELGDGLSGTVQKAGTGLATPLAAPLGSTVEQVSKLLAALLQRATGSVADVLDRILGRQRL